jgi:hypothetical protein
VEDFFEMDVKRRCSSGAESRRRRSEKITLHASAPRRHLHRQEGLVHGKDMHSEGLERPIIGPQSSATPSTEQPIKRDTVGRMRWGLETQAVRQKHQHTARVTTVNVREKKFAESSLSASYPRLKRDACGPVTTDELYDSIRTVRAR